MIETCNICDGSLSLLGTLGRVTYATCRQCGWQQTVADVPDGDLDPGERVDLDDDDYDDYDEPLPAWASDTRDADEVGDTRGGPALPGCPECWFTFRPAVDYQETCDDCIASRDEYNQERGR